MPTRIFYAPEINLLGAGCLQKTGTYIKGLSVKKALVVTDAFLNSSGIVKKVTDMLQANGFLFEIFDQTSPNPTCDQVDMGLSKLQITRCDFIVAVGGGSPQDCAAAISILATNGGNIRSYEGVHKSTKPGLPIVAINTTAGTSAEITINYVITDENRGVKMVMVDKNALAKVSVSDPELMIGKPAHLTAATGLDILTHAIECFVSKGAYRITDPLALEALKIVFDYLPRAVADGNDLEAREQMVYANFLVGLAFSNGGLGYVHAMAHQLGGMYDLPHGVCNAMLLPIVQRYNAPYAIKQFRRMAEVLGIEKGKTDDACTEYVLYRLKALNKTLGIPTSLKELGIKNPNLDKMAENALIDTCASGNPFMPTKEQTIAMFKEII